jgi:hypothetical protein
MKGVVPRWYVKVEEVAEGWRKLQMESLVSCSFHPICITEKMRLVVDDKYLHNCSPETRNEETADKTQQYRVLSGLSVTCNVTVKSCSEICWLGRAVRFSTVMNLWKNTVFHQVVRLQGRRTLDVWYIRTEYAAYNH